jgi:hypothetical protein
VLLHEGKHLVNVFSAYVQVRFVAANILTLAKLVHAFTTHSTIINDGAYNNVVPAAVDIDGLSLTPTKYGRLSDVIRKFELLPFG